MVFSKTHSKNSTSLVAGKKLHPKVPGGPWDVVGSCRKVTLKYFRIRHEPFAPYRRYSYVSRKNKRGRQMQINLLCLPLCFYAARGARLSLKFSLLTLKLFKSNFSAFSFKLFLDIFCNCFVSLFFDYLRSVVYNVFSFFKSKTC